jgi:two-component system OmpR family response regulator
MNLLLIEDYEPFTRALRRALEEEGHTVEVAGDAPTGDRLARTVGPDVILIDLVRLKADGLALLRRWRQAGLTSHVLALTAPGGWRGAPGADEMGADDYLPVPFALEELLARLRGAARLHR